MKKHKISNAYEAWWFLYEHPKLMVPERSEVTELAAAKLEAKGYWIVRDADGKCWRMWRHLQRRSIEENLDIHYAKVNAPGGHARIDDDPRKNKWVECWLEFGPMYYGYKASGGSKPKGDWDTSTERLHSHDIDLDCGGTTFDEALVALARKVRKKYGDYAETDHEGKCGKPVCGDCVSVKATMRRLKLAPAVRKKPKQ